MALVDPFIQPIPEKWRNDPELRAYIEYLHRFLHDLWQRTGGANDIVESSELDLTDLRTDVDDNTANIATNAAVIAVNSANIATNIASITTNSANIATNTANIATNTANIAINAADIASNTADILVNSARITSNDNDISNLETDVAALQLAAYFVPVSTSISYVASDFEFVNAKNAAEITLPTSPNSYSAIIVRNGDGSRITLNGNGKMINGESTGKIYRKGTSIVLQYFLDDDEWFVR